MFTGIVARIGEVLAVEPLAGDLRLVIACGAELLDGVAVGDSIAVNGCCLTATGLDAGRFAADASRETLACTTLGGWEVGTRVNLERALTLATPLGGHLVSGHVDGVGEVLAIRQDARAQRFSLRAPHDLSRFIATKGSITVDGVSLTVNAVAGDRFEVAIIPHTMERTVIAGYAVGTRVNLEVDLIARYAARLAEVVGA